MSYNTFTPIIYNGLIFCLDPINTKSYIGSGTSSYDIKNQQLGELMNGVGFNGSAFVFDGIDDYINFGPNGLAAQLRGSTEFTVSIWIKKNSATSDSIISAYDGNSPTYGWFLQWYSDGNVYCGVRNATNGLNYTTLTWTDNWYNLTYVYDGGQSLDIDRAYIFVNDQAFPMTNGGTIEPSVPTNVIDFLVGGAVGYGGLAEGKFSSIMIYNRKLSASEITQNYNALKNRFI